MTRTEKISTALVSPYLCRLLHVLLDVQGHYELTVHGKVTLAKSTFMLKVCMRITFHTLLLPYDGATYTKAMSRSSHDIYNSYISSKACYERDHHEATQPAILYMKRPP